MNFWYSSGGSITSRINSHYRSLVLTRFHEVSGVLSYEFRIVGSYRDVVFKNARVRRTEDPVAVAHINVDNRLHVVPIRRADDARLFESVKHISRVYQWGPRSDRYLEFYKAHSCLAPVASAEHRAIRHGLSHASVELNRKSTRDILLRMFGTTEIDLGLYSHQKVFFANLGHLMIATDKILYKHLNQYMRQRSLPLHGC